MIFFQSPAESLTTDSRPGSAMDEGESNSEPSESIICIPKDGDEKDPLSIALPETPSSDTQTKEDHAENDQKSPSDVATPEDEADIPAQSSKTADDTSQDSKEKKPVDVKSTNEIEENIKDSEMVSKLANLKKESNSIDSSDQQSKDSAMFIKKEPSSEDGCLDVSKTNSNSSTTSSGSPTDLKVKIEIKSEGKNGSSDSSNQMPNEQDNNNNAENLVCKPKNLSTSGASNNDSPVNNAEPKTPIVESNNRLIETGTDYSMKSDSFKSEHHYPLKDERKNDEKPPTSEQQPPPPDHLHGPPGMLRHPFDPISMMKFDMPPAGLELKYFPPDHPARNFPENALKSQFSADNLIKGSAPYPPIPAPTSVADGPIDASSRSTPNQDSQGSNSNSQPPALPSPSPLTSQPSLVPSGFVGHPGLNLSQTLPANHPSLMSSNSSLPPLPPTSSSSPFIPIPGALPRPEAVSSGPKSFSTSTPTTTMISSLSTASAFGPGPVNPLYSSPRLMDRDGLQRTPPLGQHLPHPLLSHPLQLHHLGHPGLGLAHPGHLPPHLMQSLGPNAPLPLIGGPQPPSNPLSSLIEAAGRGTPTSLPPSSLSHIPSSQHNSVIQSPSGNSSLNSSSLSRSSPHVQGGGGAFSQSHRPQSPSGNHPANLSRNSPLHLGGQPVGPSPSAISAERERQLLRQQSPHMTPPPVSTAQSMGSSPLSSKMYGPGPPSGRPTTPPPFRPGASPPVVRHPTMPLPMPLVQSPLMHPSQSPYPPHLLHPSMFYATHNPFNSPYPYSPYGPPPGAYSAYLKAGNPIDGALLHPHPIPPPRADEPPSPHSNGPKSVTNLHDKMKSPAPSKQQSSNNHSQQSSSQSGPPSHSQNSYSSHYPPSHAFMDNTLPPGKTSHIEALRAHAASAAGMSSSGPHHPTEPVHIDPSVDIEPDPEPPSPVHQIDRGPSPEAKPDDTECHRSQSAM
jgi:arginine-glutamic acid dipeptide repeats protein